MKFITALLAAAALTFAAPAVPAEPDPRPIAVAAATPAEWQANPPAAAQAGLGQAKATEATAPTSRWWPVILTCLGTVTSLLAVAARFHPPTGLIASIVGVVRNGAWSASTPAHVREAEAKQAALADAAGSMVDIIEDLGNDPELTPAIKRLKAKIAATLPSVPGDAIKAAVAALKHPRQG